MQAEALAQDLQPRSVRRCGTGRQLGGDCQIRGHPGDEGVALMPIPRCFGSAQAPAALRPRFKPAELRELMPNITGRCSHPGRAAGGDRQGQGHHQGAGGGVPTGVQDRQRSRIGGVL